VLVVKNLTGIRARLLAADKASQLSCWVAMQYYPLHPTWFIADFPSDVKPCDGETVDSSVNVSEQTALHRITPDPHLIMTGK